MRPGGVKGDQTSSTREVMGEGPWVGRDDPRHQAGTSGGRNEEQNWAAEAGVWALWGNDLSW